MATIILPDEIQSLIDAEVREHGFADAADYLTTLVRQDQKRRAKDELEQYILEGIDSGDYVEMTAETWRELRLNLHRQAGIT
jgi:antitoxin ParD1/3/4